MINPCVQVRRADGTIIYVPADVYQIQPESGSYIIDDAKQAWKDLNVKISYRTGAARYRYKDGMGNVVWGAPG